MFRVGPSFLVPGELGLLALRPLERGQPLCALASAAAAAMNDADLDLAPLRAASDAVSLERALDDARSRYAHTRRSNCAERAGRVVVAARGGAAAGAELTRRYGWHRWLAELAEGSLLRASTFPGLAWHAARHARELEEAWAAAVLPRLPAWLPAARAAPPAAAASIRFCRDTGRCVLLLGDEELG